MNVRNHLLEQARKRKPVGIYLVEFLSPDKLKLHQRVHDLKREFPNKIKAVFIRRGDIYCRIEPNGDVARVAKDENVDDLRRKLGDSSVIAEGNGGVTGE